MIVKNVLRDSVELDEYTAEYIAHVLVDADDQDDETELTDLLSGLLETLVVDAEVEACVGRLLDARDEVRAVAKKEDEREQGEREQAAEIRQPVGRSHGGCDGRDKENEDGNSTSTSRSSSDTQQVPGCNDIVALQSMFPNLNVRYLQRVYLCNDSSLEAAANDLLSKSEQDLDAEMAKMRVDEESRGKHKGKLDVGGGLDESTKAAIKQSFFLEALPGCKKQSRKNLRKNAEYLNAQVAKKNESKSSQVRFRDGVVASTKGDKFIVENTKEEWNGGSTGKVYTKGKRGKGYVG